MRIKLEFPDVRFSQTSLDGIGGHVRWLQVKIDGKPFCVWKHVYKIPEFLSDSQKDYYDQQLVEMMESILGNILKEACLAIGDRRIDPGSKITFKLEGVE